MEYHQTDFFCDKGDGPTVSFSKSNDLSLGWPYTIRLDGINIHIESEIDLIRFKNSVLDAYRQHCRERGI